MRGEQLRELDKALPPSPAERASDHDHRRSLAEAVERYLNPIRRLDLLHRISSVPKGRSPDSTRLDGETHRQLRAHGASPLRQPERDRPAVLRGDNRPPARRALTRSQ